MKYYISVIIGAILLFVLQSALFPRIELAGVVPDLMLILVISVAYTGGRVPGLLTGLFCGLLADFYYSDIVGVTALLYLCIGWFTGYANRIYDEEDFTLPLLFTGAGELVYNFLYYIINFLFRGRLNFTFFFFRIMIPKVIYTVFISVLLYKLINLIFIKYSEYDRRHSGRSSENGPSLGDE